MQMKKNLDKIILPTKKAKERKNRMMPSKKTKNKHMRNNVHSSLENRCDEMSLISNKFCQF